MGGGQSVRGGGHLWDVVYGRAETISAEVSGGMGGMCWRRR